LWWPASTLPPPPGWGRPNGPPLPVRRVGVALGSAPVHWQALSATLRPTPSIILFTTASGAGYGLLFLLGLAAPAGLIPSERWLGVAGLATALGLVTTGLLASTFHLGHPERAWRAISQWRSSWLSREGLSALLTYLPALAFALGWAVLERTGGVFALFGLLTALGAVVTVWCTGMIYRSLAPVREWHQPLVPWLYLGFALTSGALLGYALLVAFAAPDDWLGVLTLLALMTAFGLKLLYWRGIDRPDARPTPERATGLEALGEVRMTDPPHTQSNYLLHEMGFQVAREHRVKLRQLALGFGLGGAGVLTLFALAAPGMLALLFAIPGALAGLVAITIERWLFFAEATHTVTLYYGDRPG